MQLTSLFATWTNLLLLLTTIVSAKRSLSASSLVTCMENSQLAATYFDVIFDPDDGSLHYTLDFNSEINDYIYGLIDVYAYGFKIITKKFDPCKENWKQFCPLYPGSVEVDSIEYVSNDLTREIPGVAYTVPDIDAFVRVTVMNGNGTEALACIQGYFTNGKTVSQTGAKWATAVIAGIGLLTSAIASAFGNSNAASHISANAVSLFLYFQSVVVISMQHVDQVPPIAAAWAENLAWSMGLIRVSFMQKIFRWYVESTGGTPTLDLTSSTINILVQRAYDLGKRGLDLVKRSKPVVLYGNSNVLIFRGIKRLSYKANIEITSMVVTGFTFFVLCGYVLVGLIFVFKYGSEVMIKAGWIKNTRFVDFRNNWKIVLKGSLSRYIYIGFTQLVILSFWEFVEQDSPAVIVLAVLFLILALGILSWTCFRVFKFANSSIKSHNNPAAVLYGDQRVLDKYGFFYTMFDANKYWWGGVILIHTFIKAVFISFCQSSGKTQAMVFWIIDMAYMGALIYYQPYLDRSTNILNILIQTVTTINSFLFTFFSNIYGQPGAVASIMGWVFFVLNAAFSLILLVMILVLCSLVFFSKNPDTRFKPAKDDRTSFQRGSFHADANKGPTAELLALGLAAKDHNENWEAEIRKLQEAEKLKDSSLTDDNENEKENYNEEEAEVERNKSFSKLVRKLTRGKSLKRNKSKSKSTKSNDQLETPIIGESNSRTLDPQEQNRNSIVSSQMSFNPNNNEALQSQDFILNNNNNSTARFSTNLEDADYSKI